MLFQAVYFSLGMHVSLLPFMCVFLGQPQQPEFRLLTISNLPNDRLLLLQHLYLDYSCK